MWVRLVACGAAICVAAAVCAADRGSPAQEADADATTAHIKALQEGDADELRYWVSGTIIFGERRPRGTKRTAPEMWMNGYGTLVTAAGITKCKMVVADPTVSSAVVSAPPCETIKNPSRARKILAFLPELSKGGLQNCQVLDGDEWLFDGVYKGHRFTFRTDNPQFCNEAVKEMNTLTDSNKGRER
jgi:hypothetical protein